jgi:HSP20 family protein
MAFVSFDPVEGLLRLQDELDRFLGKPQFDLGLSGANVFPLVNVFTDGDGLVVRAEVPGIKPEQLQVQVEPGRLTITGERQQEAAQNGSYHRRERRHGRFSRTVQLPRDLDSEQAAAECRNGVLTVRIPKHAAAKPRQIEVRAA